MAQLIGSKRDLLNILEKEIDDNQVIILTNDFHGTAHAASKKVPFIRLPFAFQGDVLKDSNGLGVLVRNFSFAILVVSRNELNQKGINLIEEGDVEEIKNTFKKISEQKS